MSGYVPPFPPLTGGVVRFLHYVSAMMPADHHRSDGVAAQNIHAYRLGVCEILLGRRSAYLSLEAQPCKYSRCMHTTVARAPAPNPRHMHGACVVTDEIAIVTIRRVDGLKAPFIGMHFAGNALTVHAMSPNLIHWATGSTREHGKPRETTGRTLEPRQTVRGRGAVYT